MAASGYTDAAFTRFGDVAIIAEQRIQALRVRFGSAGHDSDSSGLKPKPDDLIVYKHRYSGFYQINLDALLYVLRSDLQGLARLLPYGRSLDTYFFGNTFRMRRNSGSKPEAATVLNAYLAGPKAAAIYGGKGLKLHETKVP